MKRCYGVLFFSSALVGMQEPFEDPALQRLFEKTSQEKNLQIIEAVDNNFMWVTYYFNQEDDVAKDSLFTTITCSDIRYLDPRTAIVNVAIKSNTTQEKFHVRFGYAFKRKAIIDAELFHTINYVRLKLYCEKQKKKKKGRFRIGDYYPDARKEKYELGPISNIKPWVR